MNINFLRIAQQEMDEAIIFYNRERMGLGNDFADEIFHALLAIESFPNAWHPMSRKVRRCRLRRFPYALVYYAKPTVILIIAVTHMHQKPGYWKSRLT